MNKKKKKTNEQMHIHSEYLFVEHCLIAKKLRSCDYTFKFQLSLKYMKYIYMHIIKVC